MNNVRYELNKIKKDVKYMYIWISMVYILWQIFFTLIGKFDKNEINSILTTMKGIVVLSIVVTMSITNIYAIMYLNKVLVSKYVGALKERTYTYPVGRNMMLRYKLYAFLYQFIKVLLCSSLSMNIVFYFYCYFTDIFQEILSFYNFICVCMQFLIVSSIISIVILLLSVLVGVYTQSTNKCLLTTILSVACIGNVVAYMYSLDSLTIYIIIVISCFVALGLLYILMNRIQYDDIMT